MPKKRDNAEERIARLDALMEEYRVKREAVNAEIRTKERMIAPTTKEIKAVGETSHDLTRPRKRR